MRSPYVVLGLSRAATPDDVKRAWRRVRGKLHPDRGGDPAAFREAHDAYELLSDPMRRGCYDFCHEPQRGADVRASFQVPLCVALQGGVAPYEGRRVVVPSGVVPGDLVRLAGAGEDGEPPGDLLLEVVVSLPAGVWRTDSTLYVELPVTWAEALCGAIVRLAVPGGSCLEAPVPVGCRDGHELRLAGAGLGRSGSRGDLVFVVRLVAPRPDPMLGELLQLLQGDAGVEARAQLLEVWNGSV